jgi:hypothetical protein
MIVYILNLQRNKIWYLMIIADANLKFVLGELNLYLGLVLVE